MYRPARAKPYEERALANERPQTTRRHFEGEQFIEAYLNPPEAGCTVHGIPECLCDVDLTKTEGLTWDQVPPDLYNVETVEDLVVAAANIWLNVDLTLRGSTVQFPVWWEDPEKRERLFELIDQHASVRAIKRELGAIEDHTLALIRKTRDRAKLANVYRPLPKQRILELHDEGLPVMRIGERLREELVYPPSDKGIYRVLNEYGLKPHRGPQGQPKGYKRGCGLTYREWRELYESA